MTYAKKKYLSLQQERADLIWGVTRVGALSNANHFLDIREERRYRQKNWDDFIDAKSKGIFRDLDSTYRRLIRCAKITGACLKVQGTTLTGTVFLDM